MTNEDKFNKAVDLKIQLHNSLNKESSQIQILLEYEEVIKTEYALNWLLDVAHDRKNIKLYDCITLLSKRFKKYLKLIQDLKVYEHKALYYEMKYNSLRLVEEENRILKEKLIGKGI
jgi:hypothetical protein